QQGRARFVLNSSFARHVGELSGLLIPAVKKELQGRNFESGWATRLRALAHIHRYNPKSAIFLGLTMPIGTAFHERTFALCQSLNYREWSGYYAPSVYEVHHEHEYNAIRNAAALIDITPLYKYLITGRDATKLVNRIITRDINKVAKGQVIYC